MITSMMVEMTKPDKQAPCEPMKARESQSGPQIATSQGEPARRGYSQKKKFVPNLSVSLWLSLACCVVCGSIWLPLARSDSLACFPTLPLALSGSNWLSLLLSLVLCGSNSGSHWRSRLQSMIGTQGPCSARSSADTLTHFIQV